MPGIARTDRALGELSLMALRAARGAGYPWGLAEEAGQAVTWLAARGLPGAQALADLLAQTDGRDLHTLAPQSLQAPWQAAKGPMCSLMAGSVFSDHRALLPAGPVEMSDVAVPLLLLPFVAPQTGAMRLGWGEVSLLVTSDGVATSAQEAALLSPRVARVHMQAQPDSSIDHPTERTDRAEVPDTVWSRLGALAHRTYAPATAQSRLAGAGAGLTDND